MKKLLTLAIAGLTASAAMQTIAADNGAVKPGFNGDVSLYLGMQRKESLMDTEGEETLDSLDQNADHENVAIILPVWDARYGFAEQQGEAYFRTNLGGLNPGYSMELGYRHYLANGTRLSLGYLPGVIAEEQWQDPYLTGAARQKTDVTISGFNLAAEQIMGSDFTVRLGLGERDVDDETSGQALDADAQQTLKREGNQMFAQLEHKLAMSSTSELKWNVHYRNDDADGSAMANKGMGAGVSYQTVLGRHIFTAEGSLAGYDYDSENPVFAKKRSDSVAGLGLTYVQAAPFGQKNMLLISRLSWEDRNSDINFYDESNTTVMAGIRYMF